MADRFLAWAIRSKLVHPDLSIRRHRRGTSLRLGAEEQARAVQRVVHTEHLRPRERTAAILVLVFGQQMQDVVALTWDDVSITDELVTVRIAETAIALPSPLDEPWRALDADPGHDMTATHPASNWVYRGGSPGRTWTPATSEVFWRSTSARAPPAWAPSTSSPSSPRSRSSPTPWATPLPPSRATPRTQPALTAATSPPSASSTGRGKPHASPSICCGPPHVARSQAADSTSGKGVPSGIRRPTGSCSQAVKEATRHRGQSRHPCAGGVP